MQRELAAREAQLRYALGFALDHFDASIASSAILGSLSTLVRNKADAEAAQMHAVPSMPDLDRRYVGPRDSSRIEPGSHDQCIGVRDECSGGSRDAEPKPPSQCAEQKREGERKARTESFGPYGRQLLKFFLDAFDEPLFTARAGEPYLMTSTPTVWWAQ